MLCVADIATWSGLYIASYDAAWNPTEQASLEGVFAGLRGPMTSMICSALNVEGQSSVYRPIGALISHLSQRLAWEDPSIRDIADYYRLTNLWGSGRGSMRPWPLAVYSDDVRGRVLAGGVTTGRFWDEWSMSGM
jgi:hypothetical protein